VTSSSLKCLLKLGTGKHGTIRGYVYCRQELPAGWVVWVDGHLLHRTQKTPEEKETDIFCSELDTNTLKPCGSLPLSCVFPEPPQTLYLMSDGLYVYWMYSLRAQDSITNPVTGEKIKQFPIYIHQLQVKSTSSPDSLILHPVRDPVLLQRGSLDRDKNSDVAKALALVRGNPSYASTAFASMFGVSKDDTSGATSVGMTMRVLQSCSAYTTGTSLVLVVPPNTSGGGRGLFGPSSGHASKALCVSVCFSIQSGSTLSQSELMPSPNLHCALAKGASMNSMAVCYDYHNHCVWTSNDDWIDTWDCTGKVRLAVHHLATRLGKTSASELIPELDKSQKTVEVSEAISLLLRHIAIESCRLVPSSEMRSVVPHHLSLVFLDQCCDLLTAAMSQRDWENCQAISVTLLAVLPAFLKKGNHKEEGLAPHRERVRCLVWELLNRDDCPESLHTETRRLISFNAENLFLNHKECDHFIQTLLEAGEAHVPLVAVSVICYWHLLCRL
jgi:E3 ubiquitin-protein ligase HECTD4